MELIHQRCAGLDVHKDTVVACKRIVEPGNVRREVKTFGTTTGALYELFDWLGNDQVTHVVLESTGVYWKPVWHVMEEGFELILVNAKHVKNVPGRKTDVKDAEWLAELLAHGLVRGSFVPPEPIQQLRELTRARRQFVQDRGRNVQRLQKTLEDANIKLDSFVSDILGKSGRAMLDAIIAGETNPETLAKLAHPRLKATPEDLKAALRGRVTPHHRVMLKLYLTQIDATNQGIQTIVKQVEVALEPFCEAVRLLTTIPGVGRDVAAAIVAEVGTDMSRFPTEGHLISWAGLCPRSDESAGKRRSTRIREGAPWLKPLLVQASWSAVRVKGTYLRARFWRLKTRRGPGKAIIAVAASMLGAIFHILKNGVPYNELGENHFAAKSKERILQSCMRRIEHLGYEVEIKQIAA
jgi:transposase